MLASDAIAYERILLSAVAGGNQRWSDAALLTLTDRAVKMTVAKVLFPESRLSLTTTANLQEYALPEMHGIARIYLNGQRLTPVPGNIDTLEGSQILFNDDTGTGTPVAGSGGPPGAGGAMQPEWVVQTPVSYPYLNTWGAPKPNAQPWFQGQPPRFYRRSGSIGVVPAPNGAFSLVVEGVRVPSTLTSTGQTVIVPDNFMEAIANWVMYRALAADKDELAQQMSRNALNDFDREIRTLRTWKRQYTGDDDQILPMTYRGRYRYGGNRSGSSF